MVPSATAGFPPSRDRRSRRSTGPLRSPGDGPGVRVRRRAGEGHHHPRAQAHQLDLHPALRERPGTDQKLIRERLDVPLPQVKIEARMEILDRDDLFAIGVQWGGGGVLQANNQSIVVGRGFTSSPGNSLAVPGSVPLASVFRSPNVAPGNPFPALLPISELDRTPARWKRREFAGSPRPSAAAPGPRAVAPAVSRSASPGADTT